MGTNLKCLVLGSSGLIGSNLVERLKKEGHFVVGVDIQIPKYVQPDLFYKLDLRSPNSYILLLSVFSNGFFDRVYQLAADMGGAGFIFTGNNDAEVMHNSAMINLHVANYAVEAGVKQLFY